MTKRLIISLLVLLIAPSAFASVKPVAPSIEQMAAFPSYSSFTLAPDGAHIAALRATGEERVIAVWRTDALDQAPTLIGVDRMKFSSISFIKNDLLAVSLWQLYDLRTDRVTKSFVSKLMITDLEGKKWQEPLPLPRAMSRQAELEQAITPPSVLDTLPNDPDHILVVNNVGENSGEIYKVNIRSFKKERIQRSTENVTGYQTDLDGQLRARSRFEVSGGSGAYIATEFRNPDGQWEEHFRSYVKDRDINSVIGFTNDPNIAFVLSNKGQDKTRIYEYDIAARKEKEVLFEHKLFDANGIIVNRYKNASDDGFGKIMGLVYGGPRGDDVQWVSPKLGAIVAGLNQALSINPKPMKVTDPATGASANIEYAQDKNLTITRYSPDLSTLILRVDGPSVPPEYYLYRNNALTLLAKSYPEIDGRAFGSTELVYYKARDGLDIPAFLTKPNTELCGAGPWNTVIHPHGGPWSRDTIEFDGSMWTPMLASRCMAVLRPQFRGSQGWGRKLWMAGDAEWGQKMQDDKDDGAQWLVEQGVAKSGHIAMFGFSYGGYAAFAAAVRPNDIYKCSIAGAGVSDIKRIWSRFYTNPYFRQGQAPTVDGLSPLDQAASIKIPIMVYHGDRDQTVPIEQSEWFVDKAKPSGQQVVYHSIADYGHGPAWTRKIMGHQLGVIEDYLANGCGGGGL